MHLFIYHQQYIDYIQGINHIQIIENTKDIFSRKTFSLHAMSQRLGI